MQQVWFFVLVDAQEQRLAHAQCDFLGMYADLLNRLSEEQFGTSWMRYTTFTRRDFNKELHGQLGIDAVSLPLWRQQFDPTEGLLKLGWLRTYLELHESGLIRQEYVRPSDFGELIRECDDAIGRNRDSIFLRMILPSLVRSK